AEHAVSLHGEQPIGRIDVEPELYPVLADSADGEAIAVALRRRYETALALDRSGKRAHVAVEPELVERERGGACLVAEHAMPVLGGGRVGGGGRGVGPGRRARPFHTPLLVERGRKMGLQETQRGGPPLAAQQRSEGELDRRLAYLEPA